VKFKVTLNYSVPFCVAGSHTVTFSEVVLEVMRHLEGAYALIFKSLHYPNELIACKRGSPLLLGVKVSLLMKYTSF
jgi:glucosamine--fructose-6-phosphate aminotransferase (isomerizing)